MGRRKRKKEERDVVKENQREKDLNGNENVIENELSNSGTISSKGTAVSSRISLFKNNRNAYC